MQYLLIAVALIGWGLDDVVDVVESDEVQTAIGIGESFREAASDITETEEYYIGRAVAANVLYSYSPVADSDAQSYINQVGRAVSVFSPRPATYGGYHFLLLDSGEINAMACPGGLVFVTRGLYDLAESEDELAAILAHEIAHVSLEHGLKSVEKAKWTGAFAQLGTAAAEQYGSDEVRELSESYGDIVGDITTNLVTRGYSRDSEKQADSLAVAILDRSGYDPAALRRVLQAMAQIDSRSGPGFWQTHPSPEDRLEVVEEALGRCTGTVRGASDRTSRWAERSVLDGGSETTSATSSGGRRGSTSDSSAQDGATGGRSRR
jgi:predicted Zn-dependent protease